MNSVKLLSHYRRAEEYCQLGRRHGFPKSTFTVLNQNKEIVSSINEISGTWFLQRISCFLKNCWSFRLVLHHFFIYYFRWSYWSFRLIIYNFKNDKLLDLRYIIYIEIIGFFDWYYIIISYIISVEVFSTEIRSLFHKR